MYVIIYHEKYSNSDHFPIRCCRDERTANEVCQGFNEILGIAPDRSNRLDPLVGGFCTVENVIEIVPGNVEPHLDQYEIEHDEMLCARWNRDRERDEAAHEAV